MRNEAVGLTALMVDAASHGALRSCGYVVLWDGGIVISAALERETLTDGSQISTRA